MTALRFCAGKIAVIVVGSLACYTVALAIGCAIGDGSAATVFASFGGKVGTVVGVLTAFGVR